MLIGFRNCLALLVLNDLSDALIVRLYRIECSCKLFFSYPNMEILKMARNKTQGFTLIELLVVISIIALLIGLLMPALATARKSAQKIQNMANMRSVGQSFAAAANSNKQWWTGFNGRTFDDGEKIKIDGGTPQKRTGADSDVRLAKLLSKGEIDAKVLISPAEKDSATTVYETGEFGGVGTDVETMVRNTSFVMLYIGQSDTASGKKFRLKSGAPQSRVAWHNSNSSSSPVIADRNLGSGGKEKGSADVDGPEFHSNFSVDIEEDFDWKGHVQFADTHVEFLQKAVVKRTSYGSWTKKLTDDQYAQLKDKAAHEGASGITGGDGLFTANDSGKDAFLYGRTTVGLSISGR